jgi:hypothetical protein
LLIHTSAPAIGGAVELDQCEQIALIGQRERRLSGLHRAADQIRALAGLGRIAVLGLVGQADRRIDQRIVAVDVQVDEAGCHCGARIGRAASLAAERLPVRQ